jgi:hypothetical protein
MLDLQEKTKKKPGFCPGLKLLLILTKSPQDLERTSFPVHLKSCIDETIIATGFLPKKARRSVVIVQKAHVAPSSQ